LVPRKRQSKEAIERVRQSRLRYYQINAWNKGTLSKVK
jgi:hypothetical protein